MAEESRAYLKRERARERGREGGREGEREREREREVHAQQTSSNLRDQQHHRDSKVWRGLSHEFGVVQLV